jgi:hypothetical protein
MKTLMVAAVAVIILTSARADDHMIRPQCWEENLGNGQVGRHCAVPGTPMPSPQARAAPLPATPIAPHPPSPPAATPSPPQEPLYEPPGSHGGYGGYTSTLPPQYWPGAPRPAYGPDNPADPAWRQRMIQEYYRPDRRQQWQDDTGWEHD